jgi:hypothetical protein
MRKQTKHNITYIAGAEALAKLAAELGWDEHRYKAAQAELIRQLKPTLAEA